MCFFPFCTFYCFLLRVFWILFYKMKKRKEITLNEIKVFFFAIIILIVLFYSCPQVTTKQ